MKKYILFLTAMTLLTGCQQHWSATAMSADWDTTAMLMIPTITTLVADSDSEKSIAEELKYYLDRHNVKDDGYEMVASYPEKTDRQLELLPAGMPSVVNVGRWRGVMRQGTVIDRDSTGSIIIGTYAEDSLSSGVRLDSAAVYAGHFSGGKANGHGSCLYDDDKYYEGQWVDDQCHGFGFSIAPNSHVRVGDWQDNMYLGERLHYSSERIYGIDISRYQHGKGRKKYPIQWNRLRITYLGKNQKHATGTVDYPVSFLFIKSTESTRIKNPFYKADYLQARRQGIPIGAYHFFSCRTSGEAQARYFLQNTLFRRGDLPPVLDVEPKKSQIASLGGTQGLFRQIRSFLKTVERSTHVRPILYVSQQFVNLYLGEAPDLKRDYQVWIARYGEYKPDVKLAVWQLSPNGRVSGIHGEVDINVFNGYQTQFDEFLKNETIK